MEPNGISISFDAGAVPAKRAGGEAGDKNSHTTCWTIIREAAGGSAKEREAFARRYGPIARTYLAARWRKSACLGELEDAVQEVFVECFRRGGVLERADPTRKGGFRAFFFAVIRHVALRVEKRKAKSLARRPREPVDPGELAAAEATLSEVLDRAWAKALMKEAHVLQAKRAGEKGEAASRRVELLRLRFEEGLSIREIARRWAADPASLHHQFAQARREFKAALLEVVTFHKPDSQDPRGECLRLLGLLGG